MNKEEKSDTFYIAFLPSTSQNLDEVLNKIKSIKFEDVFLQLIDPKLIVSERQIQVAVYHAQKVFNQEKNIARDVTTELLLRISGERQISKALETHGINEKSTYWLLIVFGGDNTRNEHVAKNFLKEIGVTKEQIKEINFPLLSIEELSIIHHCKEDLEEIEKRVLEIMAAVTIL